MGKDKPKSAPDAKPKAAAAEGSDELFPATRSLLAVRPKEVAGDKPAQALLDGPVFVEVLFPSIALSPRSTTAIHVQTAAGRAKHGKALKGPFDTTVPGTIKLVGGPSDVGRGGAPTGYAGLTVKGGDELFVGYEFKDDKGQTQWLTGRVVLGSDVFLDVMDRKYQEEVDGAHVGESIYFRVVDKSKHVTADKDQISIEVKTSAEKDKLEQEKLKLAAQNMFTTAAEVFGRLAVRFPAHALAGKTTVLSAQCYMRADNHTKAVQVFRIVTEDANAEKEARAEAMYWCGDAYMKMGGATGKAAAALSYDPVVEAYRMFKRLTWDYPESKWAKFARGRLTEPALAGAARGDEK